MFFKHYSNSKINPLGPQKVKKDPKIRSKYKVKIEGSKENNSCFAIQKDPKNVLNIAPAPKLAHSGLRKPKGPQN